LFAAACCRVVWKDLPDWCSPEAVEEAERNVAGTVRRSRLAALRDNANDAWSTRPYEYRYWYEEQPHDMWVPRHEIRPEVIAGGRAPAACADPNDAGTAGTEVIAVLGPPALADQLRDFCGNPFRRPPGSIWWCASIRDLARTVEAEPAFGRLPVLGDVFLYTGLDHEDLVRHCQGRGPHAL